MGGIFSSESRNNATLNANNSTMIQFNPTMSFGSNGAVNPYNTNTPTNSNATPATFTSKDDTGLTANVPLGGYNMFGGLPSSGINPNTGEGISQPPSSSSDGFLGMQIDPMILIIIGVGLFIFMGDKN